jgi:hypothetical protein
MIDLVSRCKFTDEVTAFEAYFDMYTMTGNTTYLTAIQGAWEMFTESFLHVGGAMALNEGSHGTDLNSGLWYPPKSYYLEGDSSTGFQKQVPLSRAARASIHSLDLGSHCF